MSFTSTTHFHPETESYFGSNDAPMNESHLYNTTTITNSDIDSTLFATATTINTAPVEFDVDSAKDDDGNDNLDYFIPSMKEFCMHTPPEYTSANFSKYYPQNPNFEQLNHQLPNLHNIPRSVVSTQSIEAVIGNAPIILKPNIWASRHSSSGLDGQSNAASSGLNLPPEQNQNESPRQLHFSLQELQEQQEKQELQAKQSQKQLQIDLFTQKYYKYASMNKETPHQQLKPSVEAVHQHQLNPSAVAPITIQLDGTPIATNTTTAAPATYPQHQYLTFRSYSGSIFTVPPKSRFFVIKSYNVLDVNASFDHKIWTSTELGNKRLDKAYHDLQITNNPDLDGKIFLFFSVNSSGKFCGVSEMKSCIDYSKTSDIWCEQTRWKGIFPVEWLLIKDVPNKFFQHLKIPANEFKPVTNSRDTQEVPFDIGISMLKIISSFRNSE
ncbi:hypothetical protein KGF57_003037 [Candida theae]|uniref:YTH domain-containing protein n=1 Tax=Candida theae TaxID=1198502 RepID=A0AAD5BEN8_9ASCO|nr:uncharacterized protein KGF57_003037 [Candida theae]KAI5957770.1 hypothetical protein KGF57_003037 [Candida theae]